MCVSEIWMHAYKDTERTKMVKYEKKKIHLVKVRLRIFRIQGSDYDLISLLSIS